MHHFLLPLLIQMLMLGTLRCGITLAPAVLQVVDVLPPEQPLLYPCWVLAGTFSWQVGRALLLSAPSYLSAYLCCKHFT